ncbi:MAG: vitamin K epoxide reductase family protein [Candidatus Nanopusillus sp.]
MNLKFDKRLFLLTIFSIIGIIIFIYLEYTVLISRSLPYFCSVNNTLIDCEKVLNSPYSKLFGISLGIYTIVYFIIDLFLIFLLYKKRLKIIYNLLYRLIGIIFVIFSLYTMFFLINSICVYCLVADGILIINLGIILYYYRKKVFK